MSTQESKAKEPTKGAPVKGGVVPYLVVNDAAAAAEFYKRAFGAEEAFRMPPDDKGRYMHIHLYVNGSSVMLCDAFPEHGEPYAPAQGFTLHLEVTDVEAWWKRAVDAGATIGTPLADTFWGARYGDVRDPFGMRWSMGMPIV